MIFYHPDCDLQFSEYGMEIPIVDDRAARIFNTMLELNPLLNYTDLEKIHPIERSDIERVHQKKFVDKLFGPMEQRESAIFDCYELINGEGAFERYNPQNQKKSFEDLLAVIFLQVAMTYASTKFALQNKFSFYLGGGMHHAMSFGGRGFCLINDLAITIRKLQAEKKIKTAWIIDVDVHKGDGAAEIFKSDSTVKTLSIHMKNGWPLNSGDASDPWFISSSIDVAIGEAEENQYLPRLKLGLQEMEDKFGIPDVALIVNGADPYEHDQLPSAGLINLTKEQMLLRDKIIYQFFKTKNIPQSYVMAGGYGAKSWEIYFQFLKFVWENSPERAKISSR